MFNKEQFIEDIKAMTVLELADLVKALEEEFGVSAAATAVAVAGPAAAAPDLSPFISSSALPALPVITMSLFIRMLPGYSISIGIKI